jgi:hypothetical protein
MPARNNYPATVAEILGSVAYWRATRRAVHRFARSKPWRGTEAERQAKFRRLHAELCRVYVKATLLDFSPREPAAFWPGRDRINLPRLSVVSYLHEFAHAVYGSCERQACRWSVNLFRKFFPRSFSRCRQVGHMLFAQGS